MIPYIRQKKILEALSQKEVVYIDEFAQLLHAISPSTIRRDLKLLKDDGKIDILQGGAARLSSSSYDMPLTFKQQVQKAEKDNIARFAASLVKDGDVIYLDSGTTPLEMVKYLKNKKIQIITSNTMVLLLLEDAQFSCHILGGEVMSDLGSVSGTITDNLLREMYFDKSFIGCTGFDSLYGVTTPDFREASKKRIAMERAKFTYVLAVSDKIGKKALSKAFDVSQCVLITDQYVQTLDDLTEYRVASLPE